MFFKMLTDYLTLSTAALLKKLNFLGTRRLADAKSYTFAKCLKLSTIAEFGLIQTLKGLSHEIYFKTLTAIYRTWPN
jgi:hypothetical protein